MARRWLFILGGLLVLPFLAAWYLGDLRHQAIGFEQLYFAAFGLYAGATVLVLHLNTLSRREVVAIFLLALSLHGILVLTRPTLSDDMYRYVWDGRVQANGISPYLYPPNAPELTHLRDKEVWVYVNRKGAVTIYPPLAELSYLVLWQIWPDSVDWFQLAMALGGLSAGGLLLALLYELGRSPARLVIYLWSPLLAFELAHSAHADGLMLPWLLGAFWARLKQKDALVGILLGLAAAMKLYPAFLLPALWRPRHPQGRWRMPLAFLLTVLLVYLPFVLTSGWAVLGYLFDFLQMQFNVSPLVQALITLFTFLNVDPNQGLVGLLLLSLAIMTLVMTLHPAQDAETALRRCLWPMGAFILLAQNMFSWYLVWFLPLVALFLQPGRLLGLRPNAWTGWWLFCGLVGLSYTFFINNQPVPLAIWAQYLPLYLLLLADLVSRFKRLKGDELA
jgi:alpha-1,6-mannosyltransferase